MNKSAKRSGKRRRTSKKTAKKANKNDTAHIVLVFLEFLNMIKLYHWKTRSYSQHKATDELYSRLNENIDKFVEVLLGKDQTRIEHMEKRMDLVNTDNMSDIKSRIFEYRNFLQDFNIHFDAKRDSDLLSIRDDILADVNQFLYLLSFN
jgi:DNA-binding ferritin-like protein